MKNLLPIAFLLLCFTACDKVDELTKFDLRNTTQYTIESNTIIDAPVDIITPEVTSNSESTFENNDTNRDLVESIKLKSLKLSLTAPEDGNFNFLNEITIFIRAEGVPEQVLASATNIPETALRELSLDPEGTELKDYIKKDTYTLRVNTVTDGVITRDHDVRIESVFRVDAKILGI